MSGTAHMIDWLIERHGVTLTVAETAGVLRVDEEKLVRLMIDGHFPYFEATEQGVRRRTRRVSVWELVAWIEAGGTVQYGEPEVETVPKPREVKSRSGMDAMRRRRAALLAAA